MTASLELHKLHMIWKWSKKNIWPSHDQCPQYTWL